MTRAACVICGGDADRRAGDSHHLVGRTLDPQLELPHCHDHHELVHDDWNTAGVPAKERRRDDSDADAPVTVLHALAARLRRLALWLGRLAEHEVCPAITAALAAAVARWAVELNRAIAALDAGVPHWRRASGVAW